MRRNRPPTLVTMWMLDVFCCALGCVTLLWLLKTREAGIISDEAANATTLLTETRGKLDESEKLAALRLANAEKLAATIDELNNRLALMRQERDKDAKHLALVEEDLSKSKEDLAVAMTRADTLDKTIKGLTNKLTATDAELVKKRGEMSDLNQQLELAKKLVNDLDVLVRNKEKARTEFESKLKESEKKLDEVTRSVGDMSKMQARIDQLEKDVKAERTKLDEANVTIVDLQGTKAKLADKVNKLQIETENKFAGIAMTGKNVVFLIDMSGSMERVDENTTAPDKWPGVRDTVCKVMRSLPDLEKFQMIVFSSKAQHLFETMDWIPYEKDKSIDRVHKAITAIKPTGDTNLYSGLEEAFKYRD
ncbi:MAG TPA: VWA domain-containing protein, partial [Gemmataceae bacterium]|nr:VWA domain-containing protein [Gemmataceae bacterium]